MDIASLVSQEGLKKNRKQNERRLHLLECQNISNYTLCIFKFHSVLNGSFLCLRLMESAFSVIYNISKI